MDKVIGGKLCNQDGVPYTQEELTTRLLKAEDQNTESLLNLVESNRQIKIILDETKRLKQLVEEKFGYVL